MKIKLKTLKEWTLATGNGALNNDKLSNSKIVANS